MRIVLVLVIFWLCIALAPAFAQSVPGSVTYQGKLTDAAGQPVADGSRQMLFELYPQQNGGTAFWSMGPSAVSSNAGVFTVTLTPLTSAVLAVNEAWLQVTVEGSALPRIRLQSAAYAIRAGDLALPYSGSVWSAQPVLYAYNTGPGDGIEGRTGELTRSGVYGHSNIGKGVTGKTSSTDQWVPAIYGQNDGAGDGVFGLSAARIGVGGQTASANMDHAGVYGYNTGAGKGVYGKAAGAAAEGVFGEVTGSSGRAVHGSASVWNGRGVLGETSGDYSVGVMGMSNSSNGIDYGGYFYSTSAGGTGLYAQGGTSGRAATFSGNIMVLSRSSGAVVAEIGEGLDYAEGFDVSSKDEIAPGTVLVIDPASPGKLAVSARAYDRRVAGIVAGANGLSSGVRLGVGNYDHDVALAGRVYCNVDATRSGIEPGDLLTTSATPGFAMKAVDHTRAQGAILGKAMERLAKGCKGRILVLVTLQ